MYDDPGGRSGAGRRRAAPLTLRLLHERLTHADPGATSERGPLVIGGARRAGRRRGGRLPAGCARVGRHRAARSLTSRPERGNGAGPRAARGVRPRARKIGRCPPARTAPRQRSTVPGSTDRGAASRVAGGPRSGRGGGARPRRLGPLLAGPRRPHRRSRDGRRARPTGSAARITPEDPIDRALLLEDLDAVVAAFVGEGAGASGRSLARRRARGALDVTAPRSRREARDGSIAVPRRHRDGLPLAGGPAAVIHAACGGSGGTRRVAGARSADRARARLSDRGGRRLRPAVGPRAHGRCGRCGRIPTWSRRSRD